MNRKLNNFKPIFVGVMLMACVSIFLAGCGSSSSDDTTTKSTAKLKSDPHQKGKINAPGGQSPNKAL